MKYILIFFMVFGAAKAQDSTNLICIKDVLYGGANIIVTKSNSSYTVTVDSIKFCESLVITIRELKKTNDSLKNKIRIMQAIQSPKNHNKYNK